MKRLLRAMGLPLRSMGLQCLTMDPPDPDPAIRAGWRFASSGRVWLLLALGLLAVGCKTPFSTREPETPITTQSTWVQPTSPSLVMINLRTAIAERNSQNYLRCLADSAQVRAAFSYVPESAVGAANPGLFSRWGKESERNYLNQLLAYVPADSVSSLTLNLIQENTFQDSVVLVEEYVLTVAHRHQDEAPRRMQGQAEFRLVRSSEELWYIRSWADHATGDHPTWSALRAYYGK
ncbi:MAG TPA: hypothetical protein PKI62_00605 [bacterium]|nr:hypothetical protein [bacterium]HPR88796.1 hypothetical protein [bacterium]